MQNGQDLFRKAEKSRKESEALGREPEPGSGVNVNVWGILAMFGGYLLGLFVILFAEGCRTAELLLVSMVFKGGNSRAVDALDATYAVLSCGEATACNPGVEEREDAGRLDGCCWFCFAFDIVTKRIDAMKKQRS
jgi:hypothetical protein